MGLGGAAYVVPYPVREDLQEKGHYPLVVTGTR